MRRTHVDRLLDHGVDTVSELQRRLIERLRVPFGPLDVAVVFRPSAIVRQNGLAGAVDALGRFLNLEWPDNWSDDLAALLPEPGRYALFGLLDLQDEGLRLHCLSVVSSALQWGHGPVYPDAR